MTTIRHISLVFAVFWLPALAHAFQQPPTDCPSDLSGWYSTASAESGDPSVSADQFDLDEPLALRYLRVWGFYADGSPTRPDLFQVHLRDSGATPGAVLGSRIVAPVSRRFFEVYAPPLGPPVEVFEYVLDLGEPLLLSPDGQWLEILNAADGWAFRCGRTDPDEGYADLAVSETAPGTTWTRHEDDDLAIEFVLFANGFESGTTSGWG